MTNAIELMISNNVGEVVLSQPERGNPFDNIFCQQLCDIANECSENPDVRKRVHVCQFQKLRDAAQGVKGETS